MAETKKVPQFGTPEGSVDIVVNTNPEDTPVAPTSDVVTPPETPKATEPVAPPASEAAAEQPKGSFKDRTPWRWNITRADGQVIAFNTTANETFKGTPEEFRSAMRG